MPEPDAVPSLFASDVLTDAEIASLRLFLSWPMKDIANRFGLRMAQRIIEGMGGEYAFLSAKPSPDNRLFVIAGAEVMDYLAARPGVGRRVAIPTCQRAVAQMRDAEVLKLVRQGASASDLAKRYRVHVRTGHLWKARAVRIIEAEVAQVAQARRMEGFVEPTSLFTDDELRSLGLTFWWPLADIAERFGPSVSLALTRTLGGKAVKLPTQARENHPIAACAGIEVLRFVMGLPRAEARREFILSPSRDALHQLRWAEIRKLFAAGGGVPEIALRFGVDVPTAITWLGHARAAERGAATPAPPDPQPPA